MRKTLFILYVCLALVTMLAATFFSSQSGTESQRLSQGIVALLLELFHSEVSQETLDCINYFLRRGAHLTIYFCMGVGLTGAFCYQKKLPAWLLALVIGVTFAAIDEYHQLFSGGRSGKLGDVLLDSCGLVLGCLISCLGKFFVGKSRK